MGIGPTQSAWKADVLPLNYTRINPGTSAFESVYRQPTLDIIQGTF